MPFGLAVLTPRITTGNVRTTFDAFTPAPGPSTPGPTPAPFNGLAAPLGTTFLDQGGPDSNSGTLVQLPLNQVALYKYVLFKSTSNPALLASPGTVYYVDAACTIVSGVMSEGFSTTANSLAGWMMPNTTDLPNLTAAILNNGANGSGVWICIGGYVKAATAITATAVGDSLIGATASAFTPARIGSGTAPTFVKNATALTALSGAVADIIVNIVPIV